MSSRRAEALFNSIKQLSPSDLDSLASLIASDKALFDCIFLKSDHRLNELKAWEKMLELAQHGLVENSAQVDKFAEIIRNRNAPPRNTKRDDEIVRLRDEGKSFGEIPRLLLAENPRWCGKGGKAITRDAAEQAYHRRKRPTK